MYCSYPIAALRNVGIEPSLATKMRPAERESDLTSPPLANSRRCVPRTRRADARMVVSDLTRIADQGFVQFHNICFLFAEHIAGAVGADHNDLTYDFTRVKPERIWPALSSWWV